MKKLQMIIILLNSLSIHALASKQLKALRYTYTVSMPQTSAKCLIGEAKE